MIKEIKDCIMVKHGDKYYIYKKNSIIDLEIYNRCAIYYNVNVTLDYSNNSIIYKISKDSSKYYIKTINEYFVKYYISDDELNNPNLKWYNLKVEEKNKFSFLKMRKIKTRRIYANSKSYYTEHIKFSVNDIEVITKFSSVSILH